MSLPRKILATNVPPSLSVAVTMTNAANISWLCTYSSRSCSPVTSGAPSLITRSAWLPSKYEMTRSDVARDVISP